MANEKTWYSEFNVVNANNSTNALMSKSMLWGLKAMLKGEVLGTAGATGVIPAGARWTCDGSSDSITADATADLWGATFDAAKLVRAAAGTPHSWMVLKSPAALGPVWLNFDMSTTLDTTLTTTLSYTKPTGGTTLARPTATRETLFSSLAFAEGASVAQHKHNLTMTADGDFWFVGVRTGAGSQTLFGCTKLVSLQSTDLYPVVAIQSFATAINGGPTGGSSPVVLTGYNGVRGFSYDGQTGLNMGFVVPALFNSGGPLFSTITGVDASNGHWNDFPVFIHCVTAGQHTRKGRLCDVAFAPSAAAEGTATPVSGSITSCVVSDSWFPFQGAPSF